MNCFEISNKLTNNFFYKLISDKVLGFQIIRKIGENNAAVDNNLLCFIKSLYVYIYIKTLNFLTNNIIATYLRLENSASVNIRSNYKTKNLMYIDNPI